MNHNSDKSTPLGISKLIQRRISSAVLKTLHASNTVSEPDGKRNGEPNDEANDALATLSTLSTSLTEQQPHAIDVSSLTSLPAVFISHGAPTLATEQSATTHALARMGQNLPKPVAIIIMSAHWQSPKLEINNNPSPATWHDFSGFDRSLYQINYPAKGAQALAETLSDELAGVLAEYGDVFASDSDEQKDKTHANTKVSTNPLRPFDHGVWVPLLHLYPQADVPVVQLSLPTHFDSHACYKLGAMLSGLRHLQILLIGSGSITHNLSHLRWQADTEDKLAKDFKVWLLRQLKTDIASALDWQTFTDYQQVHPSDEHLLPLFFALGAGQRVSVVHESMIHHSLGMDIYRFD